MTKAMRTITIRVKQYGDIVIAEAACEGTKSPIASGKGRDARTALTALLKDL